jgi:hypothetical protein
MGAFFWGRKTPVFLTVLCLVVIVSTFTLVSASVSSSSLSSAESSLVRDLKMMKMMKMEKGPEREEEREKINQEEEGQRSQSDEKEGKMEAAELYARRLLQEDDDASVGDSLFRPRMALEMVHLLSDIRRTTHDNYGHDISPTRADNAQKAVGGMEDEIIDHIFSMGNIDKIVQKVTVSLGKAVDEAIYDRMGFDIRTADENGDFTRSRTDVNCDKEKILVCHLNKACGFGCQMHHLGNCLAHALGTNRMLHMKRDRWSYGGSTGTFYEYFLPLSACDHDTYNLPEYTTTYWKKGKNDRILTLPINEKIGTADYKVYTIYYTIYTIP